MTLRYRLVKSMRTAVNIINNFYNNRLKLYCNSPLCCGLPYKVDPNGTPPQDVYDHKCRKDFVTHFNTL